MKKRRGLVWGGWLGIGLLAAVSSGAWAADDERIRQLEQEIESLKGEVQELKQQSTSPDSNTEARLDGIEDMLIDLNEQVGSRALVRAFEAQSIDLGGFFHQTLTSIDGEEGSTTSFNRSIFELLMRVELDENWSAFFAQAFIRQSDNPFAGDGTREAPEFQQGPGTATQTVISWANYKHSDALNLQVGRYITPHGITNIQHFPAVLLEPEQPMFLRPFGGDTLFANFTTGVNVHGRQFVGASTVSYNLYAGNFVANSEDLIYGARAALGVGDSGFTLGLNYSGGERGDNTATSTYHMGGFDVLYDRGPLYWKSEVFVTDENSDIRDDRLAFYTQPAWRLTDRTTVFYRYDFLDDGANEGDRQEHVAGITYKPINPIHLRAIYTRKIFDEGDTLPEADANQVQLSATFSF